MRLKQIFICLLGILIFSFLLNFFWESLHAFSLYKDHIIDSDKYVRMMVYVSLMDAVTILAMYVFCAFFIQDILWLRKLYPKQVIMFLIIGLIVAVAAEYWAVYITHEWYYNNRMPVIFGIGLSPFLQLSVTGIISLWLTKRCNSI